MWRTTGAIFWLTRPATIMRSDWRGEARNSSDPNRAMSNRDAAVHIISIAQQARPNWTGHRELFRAQATIRSTVVVRMLRSRSRSEAITPIRAPSAEGHTRQSSRPLGAGGTFRLTFVPLLASIGFTA